MITEALIPFDQLNLAAPVLKALQDVGYETPSPIQAQTIPLLMAGRDVLGQAQTGTGKTAAFALPILSRLKLNLRDPQVLVLTPTRELAIQVAEAFQTYAGHLRGFNVLPVYGGQDYGGQIRALKRGVHVVVGTPGRVMDHMRRGTLKLDTLTTLVLDEADEMLRMGFIEDVEWILQQTPEKRQVALFSATMPAAVRRIANSHLNNPEQVTIRARKATTDLIRQRVWTVSGTHKLDALTRILEAESFDGMIVFVRTRLETVNLADKLSARGFAATALNGDIPQAQRERTIEQLKKGKLDILVATDVAARGLNVERISHVVNYDIPYDAEAYIHRIGRTGRAGRQGDAILFVAPRERRLLAAIERATGTRMQAMELPSSETINDKRIAQFRQSISDTLATADLNIYQQLIEQYQLEHDIPAIKIAAALAHLAQSEKPFLLPARPASSWEKGRDGLPGPNSDDHDSPKRALEPRKAGSRDRVRGGKSVPDNRQQARGTSSPGKGSARFRVDVGHNDSVMPANIVGAISNEAGLDSKYIGRINIYDSYSTVDLPAEIPDDIFKDLKNVRVAGKRLNITRHTETEGDVRENRGGADAGDRPVKRKPKSSSKADKKPRYAKSKNKKAVARNPGKRENKL